MANSSDASVNITELPETDSYTEVPARVITSLYYLVFPLFQLFCSLFVIFGNLLVIIAFVKYERLRTFTNYFVVNLAASDLSLVCGIWVCRTLHITEGDFPPRAAIISCLLKFFFACMSFNCTMINLLWIAVERYIKLFYPLRYEDILTKSKVLTAIALTWVAVIVVNLLSISFHHYTPAFNCNFATVFHKIYGVYIFSGVFVPYVLAMVFIYSRIGCLTHHHRQKIKDADITNAGKDKNRRKELQVAFMMFYIIIIVLVVYGLFIAVNVLGEYNGRAKSLLFKKQIPEFADDYIWLETLLYFGILFNSAINPIVYHLKSAEFRNAFKDILGCGNKTEKIFSGSKSTGSPLSTMKTILAADSKESSSLEESNESIDPMDVNEAVVERFQACPTGSGALQKGLKMTVNLSNHVFLTGMKRPENEQRKSQATKMVNIQFDDHTEHHHGMDTSQSRLSCI